MAKKEVTEKKKTNRKKTTEKKQVTKKKEVVAPVEVTKADDTLPVEEVSTEETNVAQVEEPVFNENEQAENVEQDEVVAQVEDEVPEPAFNESEQEENVEQTEVVEQVEDEPSEPEEPVVEKANETESTFEHAEPVYDTNTLSKACEEFVNDMQTEEFSPEEVKEKPKKEEKKNNPPKKKTRWNFIKYLWNGQEMDY